MDAHDETSDLIEATEPGGVRPTGVIATFAGPGGGCEGLGRSDSVGLEWDATACATAHAAGHARVQADVSTTDPDRFAREHKYTGEGRMDCTGHPAAT